LHLSGTKDGPDGDSAPNITPHTTGIGDWSDDDLETLFTIGMLPDGDFVGGGMAEVVENTDKMTPEDRKAIMNYLKSTPPSPAMTNDKHHDSRDKCALHRNRHKTAPLKRQINRRLLSFRGYSTRCIC